MVQFSLMVPFYNDNAPNAGLDRTGPGHLVEKRLYLTSDISIKVLTPHITTSNIFL